MAEMRVRFQVIGAFDLAKKMIKDVVDRLEKAFENSELAERLVSRFEALLEKLEPISILCRKNDFKFSDELLHTFQASIDELHQILQKVLKDLEKKIEKLNSRLHRLTRARTVRECLADLEDSANRMDQHFLAITTCFANTTAIEKLSHAVSAGSASGEPRDSFQPSANVPENPAHVFLNFQSVSQQTDATPPHTVESQLKFAIWRSDGSRSIAAVGSSLTQGVGIEGMSGVGKSCALRGLATDPEVQGRFKHGIYFISLGRDVSKADVVYRIAEVITVSGGHGVAAEVREKENIEYAVSEARRWFAGKSILLLVDDLWEENPCGPGIVASLSQIVDVTQGSRVAFTTRDVRMTGRSAAIHFAKRGEDVSLQILLAAAGLEETDIEPYRDAVENILKLCDGLPMALAVAGSAVKSRLCFGSAMSDVWSEYLSALRTRRGRLLELTVDNDPYENLSSAFRASLSMLDGSMERRFRFDPQMLCSKMYRGLVVMRRQGWLPVTVLERLWETKDLHDATDVLQGLVDANLAQREDRMLNGRMTPGISLHDLHLSFVVDECGREEGEEWWHQTLLSSYLAEVDSNGTNVASGCRPWYGDDPFNDEYIRNNVCRHLLGAKLEGELNGLLRDPRWTVKRLCSHEILALEDDFSLMLDVLRVVGGTELQVGSEEWALEMIAGAARLSSPWVSENTREVWFQLYARLRRRSKESEVLRKYLEDIEVFAERPWVKPLTACLPEPGGALQSTVLCDGEVQWISPVDASGKMFACGRDVISSRAFVSTLFKAQVEITVWLESVHSDVGAVCCTNDGSRAVTGHLDGTVRLWNALTGETVGHPLRGHTERVECIALSADGTRVVSGSEDKTVRIWDAATGAPMGDALRGHVDTVGCIAWSQDGSRLASGSEDKTVRIWDAATGAPVGDALRGHVDTVGCIAWSQDGSRLASGSEDRTVRIWDAETGEPLGDAMRGHGGFVWCVAWAADGKRLASGAHDNTVRLWNSHTFAAIGDALQGHSDSVGCVLWSPDGRRVISGSDDNTIRVWNGQNCAGIGDTTRGHGGLVLCAPCSPDGRQVASGARDRAIPVWDSATSECSRTEDDSDDDRRQLVSLLDGEGAASEEVDEERRVKFGLKSVMYTSGYDVSVLATLETWAKWEYSPVTRRIVSGSGNGAVDFFELVVETGAEGVIRNLREAVQLYRSAAYKDVTAMKKLGMLLETGAYGIEANPQEAVFWYRRAVEEVNDVTAMIKLGMLLETGADGVEANPREAVELYRRALSEGNDVKVMNHLASLLENGYGVETDENEAIALYRRAILEGESMSAMYNLALLLERDGARREGDLYEAVELYRQAIKNDGDILDMKRLDHHLEEASTSSDNRRELIHRKRPGFAWLITLLTEDHDITLSRDDFKLFNRLEGKEEFRCGDCQSQYNSAGICVEIPKGATLPEPDGDDVIFQYGPQQRTVHLNTKKLTALGFSVLSWILIPGEVTELPFRAIMREVRFRNCFVELVIDETIISDVRKIVVVPMGWVYWFDVPDKFLLDHGEYGDMCALLGFVRRRHPLREVRRTGGSGRARAKRLTSPGREVSQLENRGMTDGCRRAGRSKEYLYLDENDRLVYRRTPITLWDYVGINANASMAGFGVSRQRTTASVEHERGLSAAWCLRFISLSHFVGFHMHGSSARPLIKRMEWLREALESKSVFPKGINQGFLKATTGDSCKNARADIFPNKEDCRIQKGCLEKSHHVTQDRSEHPENIFILDNVETGEVYKAPCEAQGTDLYVISQSPEKWDVQSDSVSLSRDLG